MKVLYGFKKSCKFDNPVVALGVFDGVHRGHRNILIAALRKARSINGTSIAITFWPHPQKEESLYSLKHRLRIIEDLGIDVCIVMNFNSRFSKIPAKDFVRDILVKKLGVRYIFVGNNFRFGSLAKGDVETLSEMARVYDFKINLFNVIKINNKPISSTYIRNLIKNGKLGAAEKLLMRPVSILGTVIKGQTLGRRLGYATANINPHHEIIPPSGIYAVRVMLGSKKHDGICYIGTKPTVKSQSQCASLPEGDKASAQASPKGTKSQIDRHIEVHIFNFSKNLYGKDLEIQFIKKLREEKKFESLSSLAAQICKDIKTAKKQFSYH